MAVRIFMRESYRYMAVIIEVMPNVAIDGQLLSEAQKISGHRTRKAAVTEALEEYVRRRKQARIVELFHSIDYYPKGPKKPRPKR
jgi:hypothetical protein